METLRGINAGPDESTLDESTLIEMIEIRDYIRTAISKMNEVEIAIFEERIILEGEKNRQSTLQNIGDRFGLHRGDVFRIESALFKKLRQLAAREFPNIIEYSQKKS